MPNNIKVVGNNLTYFTQTTGSSYVQLTRIESIDIPERSRNSVSHNSLEDTQDNVIAYGPPKATPCTVNFIDWDHTNAVLAWISSQLDSGFTSSLVSAYILATAGGVTKKFAMTGSYVSATEGSATFGQPVKPKVVFQPASWTTWTTST